MKRSLLYFSILLVLAITLTACTPAARTITDSYEEFAAAPNEAPQPAFDMPGSGGVAAPEAQFSNVSQGYQPAAERMVIQNANLSIVVKDPAESMDAIIAMTEGMGGFVVSSYLYKTTTYDGIEIPAANLTVRVPVAQLTTAMSQIKAMVENPEKDIITETISGEDITQAYTDLESRLTNLENAADKLNEIMASATKTEDVLTVYRELTSVTEEIEIIKGQMQYYEEAAAMSAISITLQAQEAVKPITVAGWEPQGVLRDAVQSLINFWQGFVDFMIMLFVYIIPVLLTIALPLFLVFLAVRAIVRRNKAKKAARKTVEPPQA
ncbi:MAG: DUF4349 domain-containing protein [Longilinea sp.]|nr:DUF4349 domain-containing protein [Longilinea sp.]